MATFEQPQHLRSTTGNGTVIVGSLTEDDLDSLASLGDLASAALR